MEVYTQGYCGHCLRAASYFAEDMPKIIRSKGKRVFQINQDGDIVNLLEGQLIVAPDGSELTIEEYYDTYC